MRPIRITRGTIAIGPMMMASGSGGGGSGPPKPPKAPIYIPPKEPWWKRLLAWLASKFNL